MYNPKSSKAEEFIDNQEVLDTLEYAEKNKNNIELVDKILEKARLKKGLNHREASVLLACDNKEKNEEIESVKRNTVIIRKLDAQIKSLLDTTIQLREGLNKSYMACLGMYGQDYSVFSDEQRKSLGALVNYTKSLSAMFEKKVEPVAAETSDYAEVEV